MQVRLQKYLADAGVASRRASESVILEGRVQVNGHTVRTLGTKVNPDEDRISVDGKPVKAKRKLYLALNKPPGFICSRNDPGSRPCANDLLPSEWREVYSVGRLDYDSEGLILFTNDGDFALKLTHPRYGIQKVYHVTVRGRVEPTHVRAMEKGIYDDGELLRAHRARIMHAASGGGLIEVVLTQGKNREVRRMCEAQDLKVERLVRVQIGALKLGELPRGKWRVLNAGELNGLLNWKERSARPQDDEAKEGDRKTFKAKPMLRQTPRSGPFQSARAARPDRPARKFTPRGAKPSGEERAPVAGRPALSNQPAKRPFRKTIGGPMRGSVGPRAEAREGEAPRKTGRDLPPPWREKR